MSSTTLLTRDSPMALARVDASQLVSVERDGSDLVQLSVLDDFKLYRVKLPFVYDSSSSSNMAVEIDQVSRSLCRDYHLTCIGIVQGEAFLLAFRDDLHYIEQRCGIGTWQNKVMRDLETTHGVSAKVTISEADLLEHHLAQKYLRLFNEAQGLRKRCATLEARCRSRDDTIASLKQQARASIVAHDRQIAELRTEHEHEFAAMRAAHEKELAGIRAAHQRELAAHNQRLVELRAENERLDMELIDERHENEGLQDDLQMLKAKHRERCTDVASREAFIERYFEQPSAATAVADDSASSCSASSSWRTCCCCCYC